MRRRQVGGAAAGGDQRNEDGSQKGSHADTVLHRLTGRHWATLMVYVVVVYATVIYLDYRMPAPVDDSPSTLDQFSEGRARRLLAELVREGPRPSGSFAMESHAVDLVLAEVEAIRSSAHVSHSIDVDVFRPSGCFDLAFLSYFTLCYQNVTNIVVRLAPAHRQAESGQRHAVLINCHLDTMPGSPGASDDAVSCAIMIETLRLFARKEKPFEHDVIFLFNGAEENFMQAAHGFITQHKWRRSVRAFVNLEGAGSGGRELLFQAGPGNAWLVRTYMEHAPYAHCSVLAQEIFQSGVFPSDTDFRVFRDFGGIPGLDIAYTRNGYVYHTEFDLPEFIPDGAIQRAAENALNVLAALADSPYLAHPDSYHEGRWVFFDFLGLFTVFYSLDVGQLLNGILLLMLLAKVLYNAARATREPHSARAHYTLREYGRSVGFHLAVVLALLAIGCACAAAVTLTGAVMAWYARPWLIAPLYVLPMSLAGVAMHQWYASRAVSLLCKQRRSASPPPSVAFLLSACHGDAAAGVLGLILALLTAVGAASAFYVALMVAVQLLRATTEFALGRLYGGKRRVPAWVRLFAHMTAALPGASMICFGVLLSYDIFVPTMGRSDLVFLSGRLTPFLRTTAAAVALLWLAVLSTRLGSVYWFDEGAPRLRRIIVLDTMRSVYNPDGSLSYADHGIWFKPMDYRGAGDLPEAMISGGVTPPCDQTPDEYCDLPFYGPTAEHFHAAKSVWQPQVGQLDIPIPIKLDLERAEEHAGRVNLSLMAAGPDHMSLHVTPGDGWQISSWSLSDQTVFDDPAYRTNFVFLCSGAEVRPWRLWIELKKKPGGSPSSGGTPTTQRLYVSAGAHYSHGPNQLTDKLRELDTAILERRRDVNRYGPKWAITTILGQAQLVAKWF